MTEKLTIKKIRKKIDEQIEKNTDCEGKMPSEADIFFHMSNEIDTFNFFMKHNDITIKEKNVMGAIKSMIRFLLYRPVISYDGKLHSFSLKSYKRSKFLITCLKEHLELFKSFDTVGIQQERWAVNYTNMEKIQIILKIDAETSEKLMNDINDACKKAREMGWKGNLDIITASSKTVKMPVY